MPGRDITMSDGDAGPDNGLTSSASVKKFESDNVAREMHENVPEINFFNYKSVMSLTDGYCGLFWLTGPSFKGSKK